MRLDDLDEKTLTEMDRSTDGVFSLVREYCRVHACQAHLSVQTDREGLEKGEMKLFIQIVKDGDTIDYAVLKLGGSAQIIGNHIYLNELTTSVRSRLERVGKLLDAAEEAEAADGGQGAEDPEGDN